MKWLAFCVVFMVSLYVIAGDGDSQPEAHAEHAGAETHEAGAEGASAPEEHSETKPAEPEAGGDETQGAAEAGADEAPAAEEEGASEGDTAPASEGGEEETPAPGEEGETIQPQAAYKRTVILIHKPTAFGENLFIRGGIDHDKREGCESQENLDENPCSIAIKSNQLDIKGSVEARDAWADGDNHLDWYGAEPGQGKYHDEDAQGTPAQWTTNDENSDYYSALNTYGSDYWLVDVDMDCSETQDGFFEFKAVLNHHWEASNDLGQRCSGEQAKDVPYQSANHFALCGFINVYQWGQGQCEVKSFD